MPPLHAFLAAARLPTDVSGRLRELPQFVPGLSTDTQAKLLLSSAVVLGLMLLRRGVLRVVDRRVEDPRARYRWSKTSSYASFVVGGLVVSQIWFTAIPSFGTFLGLLSAGLAIALKDLIADLAGWIFIL